MPTLHQLQQAFADAIYRDTDALTPHLSTEGIAPEARIAVYKNNVHIILKRVLTATFPTVSLLVGERFFLHAIDAYTHAFPSHSGNLDLYGDSFPYFLAEFSPLEPYPYIPDIAQLEWERHRIYFTENTPPLDIRTLLSVPQEQYAALCFTLAPTTSLLHSPYPLTAIWRTAHHPDTATQPDMTTPDHLLIYRDTDFHIHHTSIPAADYHMLTALQQGMTLEDAFLRTTSHGNPADMSTFFTKYISDMPVLAAFQPS